MGNFCQPFLRNVGNDRHRSRPFPSPPSARRPRSSPGSPDASTLAPRRGRARASGARWTRNGPATGRVVPREHGPCPRVTAQTMMGSADRPRLAGVGEHRSPSPARVSVDSRSDPLLSFAPPVADWLAFLADLLAAEVLRDMTRGNDAA
jgi:hypothetical protein